MDEQVLATLLVPPLLEVVEHIQCHGDLEAAVDLVHAWLLQPALGDDSNREVGLVMTTSGATCRSSRRRGPAHPRSRGSSDATAVNLVAVEVVIDEEVSVAAAGEHTRSGLWSSGTCSIHAWVPLLAGRIGRSPCMSRGLGGGSAMKISAARLCFAPVEG